MLTKPVLPGGLGSLWVCGGRGGDWASQRWGRIRSLGCRKVVTDLRGASATVRTQVFLGQMYTATVWGMVF